MAGLAILKHTHNLSDEALCERWVENPYGLPAILATPPDALSPRMVGTIEDLASDWRRLDERIERFDRGDRGFSQ